MPYFSTPYFEEGVPTNHRLFARMKFRKALSVLKINGEYYEMQYPSQDELALADLYYLGGFTYFVDQEEADSLSAAGYTVTES